MNAWTQNDVTIRHMTGIGWVVVDGERVVGHAGSVTAVLELFDATVAAKALSEGERDDSEN
jgi:hypothetical protein